MVGILFNVIVGIDVIFGNINDFLDVSSFFKC